MSEITNLQITLGDIERKLIQNESKEDKKRKKKREDDSNCEECED